MIAMQAVRTVMKDQKVKISTLADRLEEDYNVVNQRFRQKNVSVAILTKMLRLLDYKVVILPRDAKLPEGGIEIE